MNTGNLEKMNTNSNVLELIKQFEKKEHPSVIQERMGNLIERQTNDPEIAKQACSVINNSIAKNINRQNIDFYATLNQLDNPIGIT